MKLLVMSQQAVLDRRLPIGSRCIAISISTEADRRAEEVIEVYNQYCMPVLALQFADVDMPIEVMPGKIYLPITEEQAELVYKFVLQHLDYAQHIICQCEAGISRSAGIAEALGLCIPNAEPFMRKAWHHPNLACKLAILKAAQTYQN